METGDFKTTIEIGDDEYEVRVTWEGYYEPARGMGGPWEYSSPAEGEMNIEKVEFVGDWPEGLSQQEFDALCKDENDRLIDLAWENYHER